MSRSAERARRGWLLLRKLGQPGKLAGRTGGVHMLAELGLSGALLDGELVRG